MSTPAQGGVRPDTSGPDFTGEMAAAKAAGEAAMAAQTATLAADPGLGSLASLPQPPSSAGGFGALPVAGEGYETSAPDAPSQSGGRPHYAGPLAGDEDPYLGGA